jgi:putative transposase
VLHQVAGGVPVGDVCRQVGISEQTFYRWNKSYGGMLPSEARELRQLREENARLKRVVADLTLDKVMLREAIADDQQIRSSRRGTLAHGTTGRVCGSTLFFGSGARRIKPQIARSSSRFSSGSSAAANSRGCAR